MKILARQLAIDMYSCKTEKIINADLLSLALQDTLATINLTSLDIKITKFADDNHFVIFIPLQQGHITIHAYTALRYIAVDLFICEPNNSPESIIQALRKAIKPEKIKMTYLCRGDFGTIADMKPHTKVRIAPLRRIQNTGVKVIHLLPGSKFVKKLRRKNKKTMEN